MSVNANEMKSGAIFQTYKGSRYAFKLVERQYHAIDGVGSYFWVYLAGTVDTGEFVTEKGDSPLAIQEAESLRMSFESLWIAEEVISEGDVVVANDGTALVVGGTTFGGRKFWYIKKTNSSWDYEEDVVRNHGKITRAKTVNGKFINGAKIV